MCDPNRKQVEPQVDWLLHAANERGALQHLWKSLPLYTAVGKQRGERFVIVIWLPHVNKGVAYYISSLFHFVYSLYDAILLYAFVL